MGKSDRIDVYLVAGGKYHNIDHARLEILKLLAEQPRIRVRVGEDYSDIESKEGVAGVLSGKKMCLVPEGTLRETRRRKIKKK